MRLLWALVAVVILGCVPEWSAENRAANELFRQGRFEEALARYEALRARYPSAEASYNAGTALAALGRDVDALVRLESALAGAAPMVQAADHYNRGIVLFRLGDCLRAREAFAAALQIEPADQDARFNLEVVERTLARGLDHPAGACLSERVAGSQPSASEGDGEEMPGEELGASETDAQTDGLSQQMRDLLAQIQRGPGNRATDLLSQHPNMSLEEALRLLEEARGRLGGFESLLYGSSGAVQP